MKEAWHLPQELLVKRRDRRYRELTLSLRGQAGGRVNSSVGLQGTRCYWDLQVGINPGQSAPKPTPSPSSLKPLQRHQEGEAGGQQSNILGPETISSGLGWGLCAQEELEPRVLMA